MLRRRCFIMEEGFRSECTCRRTGEEGGGRREGVELELFRRRGFFPTTRTLMDLPFRRCLAVSMTVSASFLPCLLLGAGILARGRGERRRERGGEEEGQNCSSPAFFPRPRSFFTDSKLLLVQKLLSRLPRFEKEFVRRALMRVQRLTCPLLLSPLKTTSATILSPRIIR